MVDNLGVCKGPGNVLGQIYIGPESISISKIGRYLYALLNNRIIMAAKSKKELFSRVVPVLSLVIKNLSKRAQLDAARWRVVDKKYTNMITDTIKDISKNLEPVEIYLLNAKPDETQDNRSVLSTDKRGTVEKLKDYHSNLKKFEETVNDLQHTSGILLKTNLDKKIWGSKKVMSVINDVKSNMKFLSNDYETIDCCLERSDEQIHKMLTIISKKIAMDQIKETTGKIIEKFAVLKSFSSELAQILQRLYGIDSTFKIAVGYPATWFLNGSVFMDFLFEYDNLIDNVIKFASLESTLIEPLLVWKIKLTGVKNVR